MKDILVFNNAAQTDKPLQLTSGFSDKYTEGVQALLQRFTTCLLTNLGSIKSDPTWGTSLIPDLLRANYSDLESLKPFVQSGLSNAASLLRSADGARDPSETIVGASLTTLSFLTNGTMQAEVLIATAAGTTVTYVIPIRPSSGA